MSRKATTRLGTLAAAAGLATLAVAAFSTPAFASQSFEGRLRPGEQQCRVQYASYQVRAQGTATNQGAKFKVQYNGLTVPGTGSAGLVPSWIGEARVSYGTFPGPGYYTACVTNNGTANTNVSLVLRTDGEFS
jgi:hypothetical protein